MLSFILFERIVQYNVFHSDMNGGEYTIKIAHIHSIKNGETRENDGAKKKNTDIMPM